MKKVFIRFCVMQGAYWSFQAALPGYLAAYLLNHGMSAGIWGILQAVNLLCCLLGSLFWGPWIDRHRASRKFYLLANLASGALGLLLFFSSGVPALTFLFYPLFGFMVGPIATTLDAWVIATFPDSTDAGPKSRSFATLSYAVVMLAMGQLIVRLGYGVMPIATVLFLSVSIVTALFQPEIQRGTGSETPSEPKEKVEFRRLLDSRVYVLLVLAMLLTGMTAAPINNMKVLVFESVGGDVSFLGWDSFIGCLCQVPFLIFAGKLRRVKAETRLLIGAVSALLYALLITLARTPGMVIAGTIMTNVNFGILFPTMREMTERNVPAALRNTAHSVIDVAYGSLAGMISSVWGGSVMEHAGRSVMGMICVVIGFAAIAMTFVILAVSKKENPRKGSCFTGTAVREKC